jgi:hypothetical protein
MVWCRSQTVTSSILSGPQAQSPSRYSEISTHGTGRSTGVRRMSLAATPSRSRPMPMAPQGSRTTLNTRSTLKDQVERERIETRHGQDIRCRTQRHFCTIASIGTHQRNMSGSIRDQYNSQSRAIGFMSPMWVWPRNSVGSVAIEISQTTICQELRNGDIMSYN